MKLYWILKLLVGAGLLFALGVASTELLMKNGLDRFTEPELAFASDVLVMAQGCFDHPLERVIGPEISNCRAEACRVLRTGGSPSTPEL